MKAYIATSFSNRQDDEAIINCIINTLTNLEIQPFVFVDAKPFPAEQEKEMMEAAMKAMDDCEILIANGSHKAVGVGIEAGYAKAKGKMVVYIRSIVAEHSTTLSGISDHQIVYESLDELAMLLQHAFKNVQEKLISTSIILDVKTRASFS